MSLRKTMLVAEALLALARYDLLRLIGCTNIKRRLRARPAMPKRLNPDVELIHEAVDVAACLYPRRAACLQRACVLANLLRGHEVDAQVVIGSRPTPFMAHAWVEVEGQVIGDSVGYKQCLYRLLVL